MYRFIPLLAGLAVPAAAQDAGWAVNAQGRACTAAQGGSAEDGRLSVTYDAAADEVILSSANRVQGALPSAGSLPLVVVFRAADDRDDGGFDEGWGARQFSYARTGQDVLFSTRFTGERNVEQILADLSSNRSLGLFQGREAIIAYRLDGLGPAIAQLKDCAARAG